MRQVAESGDLTRKLTLAEQDGWWDEDAQVLAAHLQQPDRCHHRFQREAAQRERLSALGRLSTVIAHEVRNPLMIIKGALRTVVRPRRERRGLQRRRRRHRRGDCQAEPAGARSARLRAADPLRMRADRPEPGLRGCRTSGLGQRAPAARACGSRRCRRWSTDRERIRTVLVNLLTNAQHAVDAAGDTPRRRPPIVVTTGAGRRLRAWPSRCATAARASPPMTWPASSIHTSRRGAAAPASAWRSARTSSRASAARLTVTSQPGHGAEFRIELGSEPPRRAH